MKVRTAIHFARLLDWPDWQSDDQIAHFARLGQQWVARLTHGQIGPDCYFPIGPVGQSGARLARLPLGAQS